MPLTRRVLLFLISTAGAAHAQVPAVLRWEPHTLTTLDGHAHELQLGRLEVPESRSSPSSPTITVGMLRLRSTAARPGSPIVFLAGGPGVPVSSMAQLPPYWALLDSLRSIADVILLDPRGIGLSTPTLECPTGPPPDPSFMTTRAAFIAAHRRVLARCTSHFLGRGSSARALTDAAVAEDIDALRLALREDRLSFLAFGYGTRLALTFARLHDDGVDRLVLQGPTDQDLMYRGAAWHDSLFRIVAREAATDSATAAFSQDLVERTRLLLARTARQPLPVRLGTATGDSITIAVGRDVLVSLITGHIADPRIPALIATLEQGDVSILRPWIAAHHQDLIAGGGSLVARAISCSQVPGPRRTVEVDVADVSSLFGPMLDNFVMSPDFCAAIGGDFVMPQRSRRRGLNRPTLLVVGSRDDRSPPSNAAALAEELRSTTTLVVNDGGHELLPEGEVQRAVVDFMRRADVSKRGLSVRPPRYVSIEDARLPLP